MVEKNLRIGLLPCIASNPRVILIDSLFGEKACGLKPMITMLLPLFLFPAVLIP